MKFSCSVFLQKRNYVMILLMFGWVVLILLRVNLSICLVSMRSDNDTAQINTKENVSMHREYLHEPIRGYL